MVFKNLPELPLRKMTDDEIFKHFSLTEEEISYVVNFKSNKKNKKTTQTLSTVTDRSKSRVRQTAEVFTCDELADRLVSQIDLSLFTDPTKKILEPSAGNGQLVLAILRRMKSLGRTDWEHILQQQLYICEYMKDNVEEMLDRLSAYTNLNVRLLNHNIVWADFLKFVNNKITYEDWNDNRYTNLQDSRIINIMTPNEKMLAALSES
jgi:Holliday junction resolvase-like predicted endonuclease